MNHSKNKIPKTPVTTAEFNRVAAQVSTVTIIGNLLLSLFKFLTGVLAHSNAMISDAIHSASDVFSTFVVIIGIKVASKESDKEHPYGHERLECVAAILLSVVLFLTGLAIGYQAFRNILEGSYQNLAVPGALALVAAILSIAAKEAMFWYTKMNADRIDSSALLADAWHHRSDALSSVGALIGIAFARFGFPIMDSIASLIIFAFIAKASYDIFKDAIDKMVDHACDEETEHEIRDCILQTDGVIQIDFLQTRVFGNKIYVDLEIAVDAATSLEIAHQIAESVHHEIERNFPKVKHVMVHVNPLTRKEGIVIMGASIVDIMVSPAGKEVFDTGSYPADDISLTFGGDAMNEAVILSRLGKKVFMQTLLGDDQPGELIANHYRKLGISLRNVSVRPHMKTGINVVMVQPNGERSFLTNKNGSLRKLNMQDLQLSFPSGAGILCFASIFVFPELGNAELAQIFRTAKDQGLLVCADMTKRKKGETLQDMQDALSYVDYLLPNEAEACLLTGCQTVEEAAKAFHSVNVKNVIIKCGGKGCYVSTSSEQFYLPAVPEVSVVDTTGAGDSFVSGFLYGLSEGWEIKECAEYGNQCGAKCVQYIGSTTWTL